MHVPSMGHILPALEHKIIAIITSYLPSTQDESQQRGNHTAPHYANPAGAAALLTATGSSSLAGKMIS